MEYGRPARTCLGPGEEMRGFPEISVVMGVYNGAPWLAETVESVLDQQHVDLEFIIVNDGSTDDGRAILEAFAVRDSRVRIVTQNNQGLTRALIAGCNMATGKYIARQDCGDISLPGRLKAQRDLFKANPGAVLTSCATRVVGPEGEVLTTIAQSTVELESGLAALTLRGVRGPSHHGSTMFVRDAYREVGGYRPQFRVAQDLDLWLRLYEIGSVIADPTLGYEAKLLPGAISAIRRTNQIETAEAILSCARARRGGLEEPLHILEHVTAKLVPRKHPRRDEARFYYFIASMLRKSQPIKSRYYYRKAIHASKLFMPAWLGLALTMGQR